MKPRARLAIAAAAVAVLALGAWLWSRGGRPATSADVRPAGRSASRTAGGAPAAGDGTAAPTHPAPVREVTRLGADERRRLGEQIALARRRARAAAGGAASGPVPAGDPADVVISVEQVRAPLRASLEDAIPMLADCFPPPGDDGGVRPPAVATMTLTSDPDFGTVIDTAQVTDADGHPLPAAIDTCLRDRIDSLALPPLGNGGKLPLQYSFRFDDDD